MGDDLELCYKKGYAQPEELGALFGSKRKKVNQ